RTCSPGRRSGRRWTLNRRRSGSKMAVAANCSSSTNWLIRLLDVSRDVRVFAHEGVSRQVERLGDCRTRKVRPTLENVTEGLARRKPVQHRLYRQACSL